MSQSTPQNRNKSRSNRVALGANEAVGNRDPGQIIFFLLLFFLPMEILSWTYFFLEFVFA